MQRRCIALPTMLAVAVEKRPTPPQLESTTVLCELTQRLRISFGL
jgi:hypothetical protein